MSKVFMEACHTTRLDGASNAPRRPAGFHEDHQRLLRGRLPWARRFPAPFPGQPCCIEVRPSMGGIDLPPKEVERAILEQPAAIKRRA